MPLTKFDKIQIDLQPYETVCRDNDIDFIEFKNIFYGKLNHNVIPDDCQTLNDLEGLHIRNPFLFCQRIIRELIEKKKRSVKSRVIVKDGRLKLSYV